MSIPKVTSRTVGSIPLQEVSGLARGRDRSGDPIVVAIGDRAALVAWAPLSAGVEHLQWQTADLSHAAGSRIPQRDPQIEGVALDGRMGVVIVQEFPNRAEVIDAAGGSVRAQVVFDVPDLPALADVHASWQDPDGSHTEGIVLMRAGHVLLVKEKGPAALLEFGPAGEAPLGLRPEAWLPDDRTWDVAPGEVVLTCLAAWRPSEDLRRACPDFSDAAVRGDGRLLLTGDQAQVLVAVDEHPPAGDPHSGEFSAAGIWRVSGIEDKPEGVVVLPDGDVLIACDRRKVARNLFVVAGDQLR
jgi:hypothetical protein